VVGGAGFVGSNLVRAILKSSPSAVIVVDNLLSSERENLPNHPAIQFVEGSITDNAVLAALRDDLDYVFHLATYHGNQSSIQNPLADHENNTLTTLKLCERIKSFKQIKKVVYSSAGCTVAEKTFDQPEPTPEDKPVSLFLDTPYQMSKIIGELYFNYYFMRYGVPAVKARFQNVYGPGEVLGAGQWRGTPATVWRNVVPTFIYKALKHVSLPVENEGIATRDFVYVDDIVHGLMLCATHGTPGEVYNLASGVETSILEMARLVNELTDNPTPIDLRPKRDWDRSGKRLGSTMKSRREIGFEVQVPLHVGLNQTIEWTQENLAFIEACMEKHQARMLRSMRSYE
jgi:nucleoside-diphosphate-sugar epimerase